MLQWIAHDQTLQVIGDAFEPTSPISIDWGDGSDPEGAFLVTEPTHVYADPGAYVLVVTEASTGYLWQAVATVDGEFHTGPFGWQNEPSREPPVPGGCEWPVDYSQCGACDTLVDMDEDQQAKYEEMAAEFLWRWTGQQFGSCESTIRPCRQDCTEGVSTYGPAPGSRRSPWQPALVGGRWFNVGCGSCGDSCGCGSWGSTLRFEKPVYEVVSVEIDGEALPSGSYRLDNSTLLVRQDGGRWPYCQNMSLPLGEDGTWAVTVRTGTPVPTGGQIAAGKLACELAKAACGASGCELPKRVQSVTRQGVSMAMLIDTFEDVEKGRTGIWLIDSWVASVTAPSAGFSIASPQVSAPRRRTWPR